MAQAINEVNIFLQTLQSEQVVILDSYSLLAENGTTQADFAQDTLHINSKGYAALNDNLVEILTAIQPLID